MSADRSSDHEDETGAPEDGGPYQMAVPRLKKVAAAGQTAEPGASARPPDVLQAPVPKKASRPALPEEEFTVSVVDPSAGLVNLTGRDGKITLYRVRDRFQFKGRDYAFVQPAGIGVALTDPVVMRFTGSGAVAQKITPDEEREGVTLFAQVRAEPPPLPPKRLETRPPPPPKPSETPQPGQETTASTAAGHYLGLLIAAGVLSCLCLRLMTVDGLSFLVLVSALLTAGAVFAASSVRKKVFALCTPDEAASIIGRKSRTAAGVLVLVTLFFAATAGSSVGSVLMLCLTGGCVFYVYRTS